MNKTLEEKILEAKELGIKFNLVPTGSGAMFQDYDTVNVFQTVTDAEFEKSLDEVIENVKNKTYLRLLKKHDCIKNT